MPSPSSSDEDRPISRDTWQWRGILIWTLLGPSVVLLIQLETLLVVADAFGAFPLRTGVSRWTVGVAIAAFLLVCAAQLAAYLWRLADAERGKVLGRRQDSEAKLAITLANAPRSPQSMASVVARIAKESAEADPPSLRRRRWFRRAASFVAFHIPAYQPQGDSSQAGQLIARFGLEPTWAYQVLDDLGVPAAVRITRQAKLDDARSVAAPAALLLGVVPVAGFIALLISDLAAGDTLTDLILAVIAAGILLLLAVRVIRIRSDPAFQRNEGQFYPQVERLLELHRFDLYRALSLRVPADADDEQQMSVAAWRRLDGNLRFAPTSDPAGQGDARAGAQDLADLLRGPQLVGYEGFVSWEVTDGRTGADGQVRLTLAGTPVTGAAHSSPIHVEGTGTESHAPFQVTANSRDVTLSKVRDAVEAPVDGRAATATFGFTGSPRSGAAAGDAVIWLEIRQRGRFIQLLRVEAGDRSAASA